jgi:citrate synthase
MSEKAQSRTVRKRKERFSKKSATRIWKEIPSKENPYIAEKSLCHGYDLLDLIQKRSYLDVLYLLFRGELPNIEQVQLLETLFISLINPGPRHAATRAAMNAGIGKTYPEHILPIGLSVLSGEFLGSAEVSHSMKFLRKNVRNAPNTIAEELFSISAPPEQGDWHIAPGFGTRFNGIDVLPQQTANLLTKLPGSGKYLSWGSQFVTSLSKQNLGWLTTGVAACVFLDLGFHPRAGAGLFQIACAPGILAHGLEMANKPRTAVPFITDENYIIEGQHDRD